MAEPETEPTQGAQDEKKPAPQRSPSFPYVDLKIALERAEAFRLKEGRNAARPEIAVTAWKYSAKSSGGRQTLAALRSFGILEGEGAVKLTESALRVLLDKRETSPERDALVRQFALNPAMHQRLWERYGSSLPSDENLRHSLIFDDGFNENTVGEFIQEYKDTVAFAKLNHSGSMPPEGGGASQNLNPPGGTGMQGLTPKREPLPPQIGDSDLPPVTFPLPRGNAVEIRLRSKISKAEFEQLHPILVSLLRMAIVEEVPEPARTVSFKPSDMVPEDEGPDQEP